MADLQRRAIEVLYEEWEDKKPNGFTSDVVYGRLVAEGWDVPDYALQNVWEGLKSLGYIRGRLVLMRGEEKHGRYYFQWVDPNIIKEPG